MITIEELQSAIVQRIETFNKIDYPLGNRGTSKKALLDSQNHILAEDITSPFDVPRQNLSAMDGYGIAEHSCLDTDTVIQIIGESQAGLPFKGELHKGQGIRIFTGAVVPDGCNTVVMQENTNFLEIKDSIDKSQPYSITLTLPAKTGSNIRKQGEEIESGEAVLLSGKRLNSADISLLANLGVDRVTVYKPLVVGLLATGDELVPIGESLTSPAQIYNSNTPTLVSLLRDLPVTIKEFGIIPDDLDITIDAVTKAMSECDVLVSTAGVSVGDYDYLTTVVETLGKITHYKVAMKPGKPFVFGELNKDLNKPVLYFGLPGNPLSTVVGTLQFIIPALWRLSGVNEQDEPHTLSIVATLENNLRKSPGRTDFQRGVLSHHGSGNYTVSSFEKQQSHRIKQLSQANCFIVLPKASSDFKAGDTVLVQPFPW